MRYSLTCLVVLAVLLPPAIAMAANEQGCILPEYRRESDIGRPYERLCTVRSEKRTPPIKLPFVDPDQTGKALADAHQQACTCGANAILILSNSSETTQPKHEVTSEPGGIGYPKGSINTTVKSYRTFEIVTAVALRIAAPTALAPTPRPPNGVKPGFRDLAWGAPITDAFFPLSDDNPKASVRVLVRPSDNLAIGGMPVSRIFYVFAESRLVGVKVALEYRTAAQFKNTLSYIWGPPQECVKSPPMACRWANGADGLDGTIAILSEGNDGLGYLTLENPALSRKQDITKKSTEAGL